MCPVLYMPEKVGIYVAVEIERWWVLGNTRVITYFQTYYNVLKIKPEDGKKL